MRVKRAFQKNQREDTSSHFHIFVGDLAADYNDAALLQAFKQCPGCSEARVMWDHTTNRSKGYARAQEVRVNWAFQKNQREDTSSHFHIFVGDLAADYNDAALLQAFKQCPGCSEARVMWDHTTNRSKGYGFVAFRRAPRPRPVLSRQPRLPRTRARHRSPCFGRAPCTPPECQLDHEHRPLLVHACAAVTCALDARPPPRRARPGAAAPEAVRKPRERAPHQLVWNPASGEALRQSAPRTGADPVRRARAGRARRPRPP